MNLGEKIQDLYQEFGGIKGISIECQKNLIAVGVVNDSARAEIFLQGAQVSSYQKNGEAPILFLSKECSYQNGSPLRGGVPICWPWFGSLEKNNHKLTEQFSSDYISLAPAHGFVRKIEWNLTDIKRIDSSNTVLTLELNVEKNNPYGWPFSARLKYEVKVGDTLQLRLVVENNGNKSFVQSSALHTYFSVSSIDDVAINGLNGVAYIDALKDWVKFRQEGKIQFHEELDRIYQLDSPSSVIALLDKKRKLMVNSFGSSSIVVWNPWIEKSKKLTQFADDEYKKMVCIETANAGEDVVTIEPDCSHELSVTIA